MLRRYDDWKEREQQQQVFAWMLTFKEEKGRKHGWMDGGRNAGMKEGRKERSRRGRMNGRKEGKDGWMQGTN